MPQSVAVLRYSGYRARGVCALQSSSFYCFLELGSRKARLEMELMAKHAITKYVWVEIIY